MSRKTSGMICLVAVLTMIILTSCSNRQTGAVKELVFKNNAAKIVYETKTWNEFDNNGEAAIENKSEKKIVAINIGRIPSTDNQSQYVENFKEFMKNKSINGTCTVGTLNEHPLLTYTENKGNFDITFSVLVVKDGEGYYEVNFACASELYAEYKDAAFEVMKTFKIVNPSKEKVIVDSNLYEGMKDLDLMAGYDKEAVEKNISTDGSELIGVWKYEKDTKCGRTYRSNGTFKENFSEDNTNYIEGIWKYDSKTRIITHNATHMVENGKDVIGKKKNKTLQFEIKNFDGKRMYGISLEATQLRTLIKE